VPCRRRRGSLSAANRRGGTGLGERGDETGYCEVLDRLGEIGKSRRDDAAQRGIVEDGLTYKRQAASAERNADQRRVNVEHTIRKAAGPAGMAVMRLVRVDDDDAPRCTRTRRATVVKALQPGFGDADRIGLVAVPVIGVAGERYTWLFLLRRPSLVSLPRSC
jgi:hypothetical protein